MTAAAGVRPRHLRPRPRRILAARRSIRRRRSHRRLVRGLAGQRARTKGLRALTMQVALGVATLAVRAGDEPVACRAACCPSSAPPCSAAFTSITSLVQLLAPERHARTHHERLQHGLPRLDGSRASRSPATSRAALACKSSSPINGAILIAVAGWLLAQKPPSAYPLGGCGSDRAAGPIALHSRPPHRRQVFTGKRYVTILTLAVALLILACSPGRPSARDRSLPPRS